MDRIDCLRAFVRTLEGGSFSAAAKELGIGQPSISKRIAMLESEFGTQLFSRTTRTLKPTAEAHRIYSSALRKVSGLARTARGPSMSAGPGKVEVVGVSEVAGEKVFVLRFIQARDPSWVQRPFFARYDERATWLDQLRPALGEEEFFFEPGYAEICRRHEAAHAAVLQ